MKGSRVGALCLIAGSLAGLTGGRVFAQSPTELQKEIDDLRQVQAVLSKPGTVLISTSFGSLRSLEGDDFSQLMGSLVSRGELSPTDLKNVAPKLIAMTKIARDLVAKELEKKEQALAALARRAATPDAAFWLNYDGTVHGRVFDVVCQTPSGNRPGQSGKFAVEFMGDGRLSIVEAAPATGRVIYDGSMSAQGDRASSGWWGRFRRGSDGTISGKGTFGTQTFNERCDGHWSVP